MIYSHCAETGVGPVQGPNGKYGIMLKCLHWSEPGIGTSNLLLLPANEQTAPPCTDNLMVAIETHTVSRWAVAFYWNAFLFLLCQFHFL